MKVAVVTASSLNLRDQPGMAGAIVARLPRDTRLELLSQQGVWYLVQAGQQRGYVHGDYVRIVEAPSLNGFLKDQPALLKAALAPARLLPADPAASTERRGMVRIWNGLWRFARPALRCARTRRGYGGGAALCRIRRPGLRARRASAHPL